MRGKFIINNLEELQKFVKDFLVEVYKQKSEISDRSTVISLVGDLGAGKTTFVQWLAKELGVREVVNSPTYIILKQYDLPEGGRFKRLVHMDAYRLDSVDELKPLRFDECLSSPDTILCIEWADKIREKLPSDIIEISIKITEGEVREVVVK